MKLTFSKDIFKNKNFNIEKNKINNFFSQNWTKNFLGWNSEVFIGFNNNLKNYQNWAEKISEDILIVIGIGGSFLGAKSICEAFFHKSNKKTIIWFANTLSEIDFQNNIEKIKDKNFHCLCISKSGTTLETLIGFSKILTILKKRNLDLQKNITIVSEKNEGFLYNFYKNNNCNFFELEKTIGGRYSIFSAANVLPMFFLNLDVKELVDSAKEFNDLIKSNLTNEKCNDALRYAIYRNHLFNNGLDIEILINFHNSLDSFNQWWIQLFSESQGKNNLGIFPASLIFSKDLHSFGQFIQQGKLNFFETFIFFSKEINDIKVEDMDLIANNLKNIDNKNLFIINKKLYQSVLQSHEDRGIFNTKILLNDYSLKSFGELIQFFFWSCVYSCIIMDVNPFDQPGVELYKSYLKKLLVDN
ncbi:hypothetical protein JTY60_02070 [symbiont of Argiope bruennichi]|uniref:hypothetical protein n=1 Tax=symbiont of Argiope bruennichi TaxID=2810479 RepID=UPI003DA4D602